MTAKLAWLWLGLSAVGCGAEGGGVGPMASDAAAVETGPSGDRPDATPLEGGTGDTATDGVGMEAGADVGRDAPASDAADAGKTDVDTPDTPAGRSATIPPHTCFDLATGTGSAASPCKAHLYTWEGAKVDISAGSGFGGSNLCELAGTYADLSSVPTSYATCAWTGYVEGALGLAKHALIVRDEVGPHHYRVWIESNELPALIVRWSAID